MANLIFVDVNIIENVWLQGLRSSRKSLFGVPGCAAKRCKCAGKLAEAALSDAENRAI